jgi:hypothetical protein
MLILICNQDDLSQSRRGAEKKQLNIINLRSTSYHYLKRVMGKIYYEGVFGPNGDNPLSKKLFYDSYKGL